ncbi:restriction endonuclease [Cellulomonas fimi ATCC 484]|uniref:Restriction endonuclease n=1 Tax=Cellulomonas fimi (strain ATCC 484 / DSM 20113 / JCM 1341 / CCUG 24087 / LMG 16345 / NBRC 15513 / NCIMB 8980 / NCTC 7547 / NRS-133) TaxID=590998 RepID=F4H556_CELFA|nr:restriction endonuclease [Cellulomonas fimi ATCC 484]
MPGRHVLTPREAEEMAAHHMRQLGHPDARTNPGRGADGGLDVTASRALAQVKFRGGRAGRPDLQRLYGARADRTDLELWFFTGPGYSDEAVEYADRHAMVLFTFDLAGALTPANQAASDVLDRAAALLASGGFGAPARDASPPRRAARPSEPDAAPDGATRWWDGPQHPAPEPEFTGWRWVSPGRAVRRNLLLVVGVLAAAAAWLVGANVERVEHAAATVERLTGRVVDVGAVFVWSSGVALAAVVLYVVQVAIMFRLGKHPLKVPAGRRRRRQRERASVR